MPEAEPKDAAPVRLPPPLVPLFALALGWALQLFLPLPRIAAGAPRWLAGALLCALGVGVVFSAFGLFRKTGQDPAPWEPSPELLATGIYRFTRNPMYLGLGLLQAGIGVLLGNLWMVALVPASWAVIYWTAIRHEEAYLERKFGIAYLDYKKSVRRWL